MKFRPLHDRVLIEVLDSEEKTAGGIIMLLKIFIIYQVSFFGNN